MMFTIWKRNNGDDDDDEEKKPVIKEEIAETYHKQSLKELAEKFETSLENGLSCSKANQLLCKYGPNKIHQKREHIFRKIFGYFLSGFGGLFLCGAVLCILAWRPLGTINNGTPDSVNLCLGVLLVIVVIIQGGFNAFQDWSSQRVMKSIKNMMPSNTCVIRSGKEMLVATEEIVVGDIIRLSYGNKVPADCRIIETKDLKFDKSMLTGESEAIEGTIECTDEKYVESKNIAYMTTLVTQGQGKGVVVATGDNTMMGKIAGLTSQTGSKKTSLQVEIHRFVTIICIGALLAAAVVFFSWYSWLHVSYPRYISFVEIIVTTISVVIGFIPDGLPVSVTLSLLIIAMRMKKSRVLVKNLTVIETLSCVNVIASDKTGTLTQNKMYVTSAAAGMEKFDFEEVKSRGSEKRSIAFEQLVASCGLCNDAKFIGDTDTCVPVKMRAVKGDSTDAAILKFSAEFEKFPDLSEKYYVRAEIPFNSKNKWMVKIVRGKCQLVHGEIFGPHEDIDSDIILLKGAPDYLAKKSTHVLLPDGSMASLTADIMNRLIQIQNDWCVLGQRVLLICKKKCKLDDYICISDLERYIHESDDFCIIGLVGIIDPPREGIADVLAKCKTAGIRVLMVTGDYALTAAAIAVQIGILSQPEYDTVDKMRLKWKEHDSNFEKNSLLLTGNDLDMLTSDDWRLVTAYKEIVLARTTPEQKLRTVKEFQSDGYIVGVTGDGVNDAPALKSADIGIAMGSGSEVAMEASQLVLLDNNFESILVAIENGRLVFDNLRKVILFLLPAGSMGQLVPVLCAVFLGIQLNLSSFSMLLIALFTDIPPSLAMMKEPPETDLLSQPPRSKRDHLADRKFLLQAYLFMGTLVVCSSQIVYFIYMYVYMNMKPSQIFFAFDKLAVNYNETNWMELKNLPGYNYTDPTDLHELFNERYYTAQTVTFTSLVMIQTFGNLLCTRTHIKSFFQQPPWDYTKGNRHFFLGQFFAVLIMLVCVYTPWFHSLFNTRPVPIQFLFIPLIFCFVIFCLDELRKLFVRRKYCYFHKIAW